jgi:hypothetical protein
MLPTLKGARSSPIFPNLICAGVSFPTRIDGRIRREKRKHQVEIFCCPRLVEHNFYLMDSHEVTRIFRCGYSVCADPARNDKHSGANYLSHVNLRLAVVLVTDQKVIDTAL